MKKFCFVLIIIALLGCCGCKSSHTVNASVNTYTVTFVTTSAEKTLPSVPSQKVKAGECANKPQIQGTATVGYRYIWALSSKELQEYDFTQAVTQDVTLYVAEAPREFSITYLTGDGDKGSNPTTYTVADNVLFSAPNCPFGCSFIKWCYFDDEDSDVTELPQGSMGDKVLRAVYGVRTYEVYYRLGGGTNNLSNPSEYVYGTDVTLLAPTKDGYVFDGWYAYSEKRGEGGGVLKVEGFAAKFVVNNSADLVVGGVIVLEAHWRAQ